MNGLLFRENLILLQIFNSNLIINSLHSVNIGAVISKRLPCIYPLTGPQSIIRYESRYITQARIRPKSGPYSVSQLESLKPNPLSKRASPSSCSWPMENRLVENTNVGSCSLPPPVAMYLGLRIYIQPASYDSSLTSAISD